MTARLRHAVLSLLLVACQSQHAPADAGPGPFEPAGPDEDLALYVNPFIGTGDSDSPDPVPGGKGGSVFPGASMPFGMVQFSPDTPNAQPAGYAYGDDMIKGFSLTHLSGAGCNAYGDFPLFPSPTAPSNSPEVDGSVFSSRFAHQNESASPGYYRVRLDSGVDVQLTVTQRTGFARFEYPDSAEAWLLLSARGNLPARGATIEVRDDGVVLGSRDTGGFCGTRSTYQVFFAARFDHPIQTFGTWQGSALRSATRTCVGANCGAYLKFDTTAGRVIQARIGVSFTSAANALANLDAENPDWNFAETNTRARRAWNGYLNRAAVSGGDPADVQSYYTALYHAFLHPNVFSDVNGEYSGFDKVTHHAEGYTQYANFSGWDIFRSWAQLIAFLAPDEMGDITNSLVQDGLQCGQMPLWSLANDETAVMVGDPADTIVANAYAFGATRFDTAAALYLMVSGATGAATGCNAHTVRSGISEYLQYGYVPLDASTAWGTPALTLEYALADFSIARFAESQGDTANRDTFLARSRGWDHLFNPASKYVQPRFKDGSWLAPFDPASNTYYVEGNATQYTFMIPHDLPRLFSKLGGNEAAVARLDALFTELNAGMNRPYFYMGNEPQFGTPWAYDFAGAPHKTQDVVRRIVTQVFSATPGGLPGNDDLGATSSWFVWAAWGMYPEVPGVGGLALNGPLFPSTKIRVHGKRVLNIVGAGAARDAPYIQRLVLNGVEQHSPWLDVSALSEGGTLEYTLGATADPSWAPTAPPTF